MKNRLFLQLFFLLVIFAIISPATGFSQFLQKQDRLSLSKKEDSLRKFATKLIQGINPEDRFKADSMFTKMFVRALRTPNSFFYPFDSLTTISKQYSPDSTFKIFTWQMVINESVIRQHGAIQMRTEDGSLKLFPLIDKSDITQKAEDTIADNRGWIGAVYYRVLHNKDCDNNNVYTLLGYDENNIRSTKKVIDILTFVNGQPIFGGPYFSYEKDTVRRNINRFILEFKKDAGARLAYDDDMQMLIVEHLVSETNEPKKKWTMVPDGDYEGFKWENCKWLHINKVFNYVTPEGQAPVPDAVLDAGGNVDESKLKGGEAEEKPKPATKPKPKPKKK